MERYLLRVYLRLSSSPGVHASVSFDFTAVCIEHFSLENHGPGKYSCL